jgi:hypothetical protein
VRRVLLCAACLRSALLPQQPPVTNGTRRRRGASGGTREPVRERRFVLFARCSRVCLLLQWVRSVSVCSGPLQGRNGGKGNGPSLFPFRPRAIDGYFRYKRAISKQAGIHAAVPSNRMRCATRFPMFPSAFPVRQPSSRRSPSNHAHTTAEAARQKTHHARSTARHLVGTRMRFLSKQFARRMICAFRCTAAHLLGTTRSVGPSACATRSAAFPMGMRGNDVPSTDG